MSGRGGSGASDGCCGGRSRHVLTTHSLFTLAKKCIFAKHLADICCRSAQRAADGFQRTKEAANDASANASSWVTQHKNWSSLFLSRHSNSDAVRVEELDVANANLRQLLIVRRGQNHKHLLRQQGGQAIQFH
jgi:hypothetical protein